MSKTRLQVLIEDRELRQLRAAARAEGIDMSEWVRRRLRDAHAREPQGSLDAKLAAVRTAVEHDGPTADIDQMLSEVEAGYGSALPE